MRSDFRIYRVIARLKPGIKLRQAQMEMDTIAGRLLQEDPERNAGWGLNLVPLHEQVVGHARLSLLIFLAAAGFVLLIACANVANLLLARAATRQREIAIRVALGAGRRRLIGQLLTESVLLAGLGGVVGVLLALWSSEPLASIIPRYIPRWEEISIDHWVFGFTLAISMLTGLAFGLAPALQASRLDVNESLKKGARDFSMSIQRLRLRSSLVAWEVALALLLLIGAGPMLKSFWLLQQVDPGFNPENVLTMHISLPGTKYAEPHQRATFYQQVLQRVEAVSGVQAVGAVTPLPSGGAYLGESFAIKGHPLLASEERPWAVFWLVSPNYFRAMGIPLLKGRSFSEQDVGEGKRVVLINETMARRFWPGEDAIGKRIQLGDAKYNNPWLSIVGVVGDVRDVALKSVPGAEIYDSYSGLPPPEITLVVRGMSDPTDLTPAVRSQIRAVDRDVPVEDIRTMEQVMSRSLSRPRFYMPLLGILAFLALGLATVGVYGVTSYWVSQRRHEIGIRLALGAQRRDIFKLVVGQGMVLTLIGVSLGLAAAVAFTRFLSTVLYGVSATDPVTFVGFALLLVAAALLACAIPARRATRVDPMVALRYE